MLKTTNTITPEIVFLSAVTSSVTELGKLEQIFNHYNINILPKTIEQVHPEVNNIFFNGDTAISLPETEILGFEIVDDSIIFDIKSVRYNPDNELLTDINGKLLFTGTKDFQAEFEGSPSTLDYLQEIILNRMIFDAYFDVKVLPDGTVEHLIDIYSFNEENIENNPDYEDVDLDDIETLHIQFKFTGFSSDLEETPQELSE